MNRFVMLSIALAIAGPAIAQDQPKAASKSSEAPPEKLQTLLQNCDAHKFETIVETTVDGQPHRSKFKMCGNEGQTDAEWLVTLQDAITKLEANTEIAASTRDQIVTAIKGEIDRLQSGGAASASTPIATIPEGRATNATPAPLSQDYSVLPPIPQNDPPKVKILPDTAAAVAAVSDQPPPEPTIEAAPTTETVLPPTVEAATPPPVVSVPAKAPPPAKPRLTFSCISPEYPGGGECITLSRDTILSIRPAEALPAGVSLRFFRRGEQRGEIALGAMRSGRSVNFALPQRVCSGVVTSEVEIAVFRNGQSVDRRGPYLLHC